MNTRSDVLVVGSGIAGLFTALRATSLGSVTLVTKSALEESNTRYAQGGIAAVMFEDDEIDLHIADTLAAGAGLCNEDAVRVLCTEGPKRIADLLNIGVAFDRDANGLARGLEAAHSRSRVLHAGGDATGAEIERALAAAVRLTGVTVLEHTFLCDLIVTPGGAVTGARFLDSDGEAFDVEASAVILASGGAGQAFRFTTNPEVATGDGVAAAFRAGALIADAEMYQFHPTLLATGTPFLVSEAVRGEGAVLRNQAGERFMLQHDVRAELAPRDVVARAIAEQMASQDGEPVLLDATALGASFLASRFPTIDAHCRANGFDWATTPVPITPAAHFWMGGIATDKWGRTSIPNLYAVGEVACTGVHGANRLASNSLLEGIVFGDRVVRSLQSPTPGPALALHSQSVRELSAGSGAGHAGSRADVQRLAWENLGLVRDGHGLRTAQKQLAMWSTGDASPATKAQWELANLITVASLIAEGAIVREESRGGHYRSDFPKTSDAQRRQILLSK